MNNNAPNEEDVKRKMMLAKLNAPVEPEPVIEKTEEEKAKENFNADYEYTRKKLKSLVDVSVDAIEDLKEIALETGEPRAYRALGELIKNAGDLTKGVMDSAKSKAEIDKSIAGNNPKESSPREINNNTVFIGSTKDLLDKIIEDDKKAVIIDVDYKPAFEESTAPVTKQENE